MATTEADFYEAMASAPFDADLRLTFADWLEEQGDPRAELIRIQHALRRIDVPDRAALELRMHALLDAGVSPLVVTCDSPAGELVAILPGEFLMGSPVTEKGRQDDEGQVRVTMKQGFWLGRTTVTQKQWRSTMGSRPWIGKRSRNFPTVAVTSVNWEDAVSFCRKATAREWSAESLLPDEEYRLPTEAEWEYACRAGTTTAYSFGSDESQLGDYAWFAKNPSEVGEAWVHEVGLRKSNGWGLYDMHGNVWEWCRDNLPVGDEFRELRGGCRDNPAEGCRSASHTTIETRIRSEVIGFRVVCNTLL